MKEIEPISDEKKGRRKLLLGIGLLSLFPILKLKLFSTAKKPIACSPSDQQGTMKLLTQDGKLVEVDISKLNASKKKISDKELLGWIKKS
jgi:hypothetical protein